MTDEVDASIVEKVRKLMAKAERTDSQAEAEAFFAKATELMQKHMIDEAMLAAAGGREQDEITRIKVNFGSTYWQAWRTGLSHLARAFGFHYLLGPSGKNGYGYWYGWKSELDVAEVLLASLEIQVTRGGREFMKTYQSPGYTAAEQREDRFKAKRSFVAGFIVTVAERIGEQRQSTLRAESRNRGQSDGSLLPVLMDRNKMLRDFWDQYTRGVPKVSLRSGATNGQGFRGGQAAGRRADIGQPRVGGSRGSLNRG